MVSRITRTTDTLVLGVRARTNVTNLEIEAPAKLLLYGNEKKYSIDINRKILLCYINFVPNSNRFEKLVPLRLALSSLFSSCVFKATFSCP